jgi:zinc/manganese transport system substrate-binding protein
MLRRLACVLLIALAPAPANAYGGKLRVVASFSILADMVKRVGGDNIELTTLVGPDADAHAFEPTPQAIRALEDADLVIVNGLNFESWMGRLIVTSGYSGPVAVAARDVTALNINDKLEIDPHAWQSVTNSLRYVANIRDALSDADRRHSARYKDNAEIYSRELKTLESWIQAQIESVPQDKRVVITTHDAFQYFARYYNVRFLAASGVTNDSNPSAAAIAKLIDQMRKEQVRALFFENISNDKLARQLEEEAGAHTGGTLYSDALSKAGGPATTYIDMMRYNVTQLVDGMMQNGTILTTPTTKRLPDDTMVISIP